MPYTCTGPNCKNRSHTRGLCMSHVKQLNKFGELTELRSWRESSLNCEVEDCPRRGYIKHEIPKVLCLTHRKQQDAGLELTSLVCTVDDCSLESKAQGYCKKHYTNWQNHGTPIAPPRKKAEPRNSRKPRRLPRIDVFNSRWIEDTEGCHIWSSGISKKTGQGYFSEGSYQTTARNWIYAYNLPEGEVMPEMLRMTCKKTLCVNTDHMYGETRAKTVSEWHKLRKVRTDYGE